MDSNTQRILESVTHKTLHAHAFSRSSSQATLVLTDLLSRYLSLLSSTCGRYAEHAGRTRISMQDALQAMDELGTSVDELQEYGLTEGKEMNRYAVQSARRVEELNEYKSQLFEGLRQDRDDAIPLQYSRVTEAHLEDSDIESEYDESADEAAISTPLPLEGIDVDIVAQPPPTPQGQKRKAETPPLPPSPVSNSPSPLSRKRARISKWNPPEHIPDFMPPFPSTESVHPESAHPSPRLSQAPDLPPLMPKPEEAATALVQSLTSTDPSSGDMLAVIPYSQSRLALLPERHLPSAPPPSQPPKPPRFAVPQIEPSFLGGYHYILTHPPPAHPPPPTTQRHKVAMALLDQIQNNSRWTPADTLYASVAPCAPRVSTMAPSHPVATQDLGPDGKPRDGKDEKAKFPPFAVSQRPVSYAERLAPMASLPSSHIPNLAKNVLHPTILARTTRLTHPPVLYRGTRPLVYGQGIPAPWNTAPIPPPPDVAPGTPSALSSKSSLLNGTPRDLLNGKVKDAEGGGKKSDPDAPKPPMPDARLFATWDYETKDFRVPITRTRGRAGASGSGVITLPNVRSKHAK